MGQTIGDRLRDVANRLDVAGEDLKEGAKAALRKAAEELEQIADRIEAGDDFAEDDQGVMADTPTPSGEA